MFSKIPDITNTLKLTVPNIVPLSFSLVFSLIVSDNGAIRKTKDSDNMHHLGRWLEE
jgi:hypothetical protein